MKRNCEIIVTGDICINTLQWKEDSKEFYKLSYNGYPSIHKKNYMGGALLLAQMIRDATVCEVESPVINTSTYFNEEGILVSVADIEQFPVSTNLNGENKVYRIKHFSGFELAEDKKPMLFPIQNDNPDAAIVVLDDSNNGFSENEAVWPKALRMQDKTPIIIYKSNKLDFSNPLWVRIKDCYITKTIVVINADDLRAKGVNISKGLSWEKTGIDFVWQMKNNPELKPFLKCRHILIPFGLEGVIYYNNENYAKSHLYFLTYEFEGGFIKEGYGSMYGLTSCFVAGLAKAIYSGYQSNDLADLIDEGIREGMVASQKYFLKGFGADMNVNAFPDPSIFIEQPNDLVLKSHIQDVEIKSTSSKNCQGCWYIIKEKSSSNLAEIAFDIVKYGDDSALKYIPIARFGNLKTVDRTEIEAYRSIKQLIAEYISSKNVVRPLSIAVFGTPGSGKSFGVTEVAASLAPGVIQKLDFNISQFQSVNDLVAAFHKVRDVALVGKIPLVFFDEFDSTFGDKLGWLKYFLAPMQDGTFREGDSTHPIGKAIFVFAGGTAVTYEEFCGQSLHPEDLYQSFYKQFKNAKGPDFVSRLRGYVNILGVNQKNNEWDPLFIIRRAMLLRSLLERKTPHLITASKEALIDNGVIRAMLNVPRYKHESRSMEAIIEMSMLTDAKKWEQALLPASTQLRLHVDEEQFNQYLMMEGYFSEKADQIVKLSYELLMKVYEEYHLGQILEPIQWINLSANHKKWVYSQVKFIPTMLQKINYDILSVKEEPQQPTLLGGEIETLAQAQHKNAVLSCKQEGEHLGKDCILSWNKISNSTKEVLVNYIKSLPNILSACNLKIERQEITCQCENK